MLKSTKSDDEKEVSPGRLVLERLIKTQHVLPVNNLNELSDLWPVDDDPDALMEFILNERKARRKLPQRAMLKDS